MDTRLWILYNFVSWGIISLIFYNHLKMWKPFLGCRTYRKKSWVECELQFADPQLRVLWQNPGERGWCLEAEGAVVGGIWFPWYWAGLSDSLDVGERKGKSLKNGGTRLHFEPDQMISKVLFNSNNLWSMIFRWNPFLTRVWNDILTPPWVDAFQCLETVNLGIFCAKGVLYILALHWQPH